MIGKWIQQKGLKNKINFTRWTTLRNTIIISIATLQSTKSPTPKNLRVSLFVLFPKFPRKSLFCPPQAVKEEATRRKELRLLGCRWGKEQPAVRTSTCPDHLCPTGTLSWRIGIRGRFEGGMQSPKPTLLPAGALLPCGNCSGNTLVRNKLEWTSVTQFNRTKLQKKITVQLLLTWAFGSFSFFF